MKFSDKHPKFAAFLKSIGINAIDESATEVKFSANDCAVFEKTIDEKINAVQTANTELQSQLTKAQDDLKAEQAQLTALATAIDAGCKAAGVDTQKNLAEGVKKMTETLNAWGKLPGAMTTTPEARTDEPKSGIPSWVDQNSEHHKTYMEMQRLHGK